MADFAGLGYYICHYNENKIVAICTVAKKYFHKSENMKKYY